MNELALFAGAGGGILGGKLLGWRTVCAVEFDAYAASVLVARQNDGCMAPFPVWNDVRTFDGRPWRGRVDVVSGGFPCQDISAAGKGAGLKGARSGLWSEMARIVGEVRPRYVLVENSPLLVSRGLDVVLSDLAALGYDARWGVVGAHHAGAPHKRDRIWIVANATSEYCHTRRTQPERQQRQARPSNGGDDVADAEKLLGNGCDDHAGIQLEGEPISESGDGSRAEDVGDANSIDGRAGAGGQDRTQAGDTSWWATEPDVGRVANGVAARVDRLKAIGNGQVPAVVALAWRLLAGEE
jgi:DNA (cytosine-5)-methyltransferase 1